MSKFEKTINVVLLITAIISCSTAAVVVYQDHVQWEKEAQSNPWHIDPDAY